MENSTAQNSYNTKFCKHCGAKIPFDAVICTACGRQVEQLAQAQPQPNAQPNIIINNANTNTNVNNAGGVYGRPRSKWVGFLLCFFLGCVGAHKFYEGKTGMGILYIFTCGLFGIGWLIDTVSHLFKSDPYYV